MGKLHHYQCNDCEHEFQFTEGPVMRGHIAHCLDCGKEKLIRPDELPLELWGYHSFDFEWGSDLSEKEPSLITAVTGLCSCGGNYSLKARPRCPKCRSDSISEDKLMTIQVD